MRPMSRHFGEIHGVDVSDEMVAQARRKLARYSARPSCTTPAAATSRSSPPDHFDFVYSYAVFQHIPSAEVVFSYLRETVRVLKPGGFARLQINGPSRIRAPYTTWEGVRICADEIRAFTRPPRHPAAVVDRSGHAIHVDVLAKAARLPHPPGGERVQPGAVRSRDADGSHAPRMQIENLPEECDLNSLKAFVDGVPGDEFLHRPRGQGNLPVQRFPARRRSQGTCAGARRMAWQAALSGFRSCV